jgi:hypothetical protein
MKKIIVLLPVLMLMLMGKGVQAYSSPVGIGIDFCTKAYWDGQTKSCQPREHGFCLHITIEVVILQGHMIGSINNTQADGLTFTFSKKTGILQSTFDELFKGGYFVMDGEGTLSDDLLQKLGLKEGYRIPAGKYPFYENDGVVTIKFR